MDFTKVGSGPSLGFTAIITHHDFAIVIMSAVIICWVSKQINQSDNEKHNLPALPK